MDWPPSSRLVTRFKRSGRRRETSRQSPLEEIAIAITALIRRGFPPDYAMSLTPRQITAYLEFSDGSIGSNAPTV